RLAEPGRTCSEVMPPASAAAKPGSCGQTECSAQTWEVTGDTISLPSLCERVPGLGYTPRCECTSISPGVTHLPVPSTVIAPAGADRPWPTATISPPANSTSAPSRRVPVPVSTVALVISTGGAAMTAYVLGYASWAKLALARSPAGSDSRAWVVAQPISSDIARAAVKGLSMVVSPRVQRP